MEQREKASRHSEGRAAGHGIAGRRLATGLAVEGPGFLVWDEVASDARRRAGELWMASAGSRSRLWDGGPALGAQPRGASS